MEPNLPNDPANSWRKRIAPAIWLVVVAVATVGWLCAIAWGGYHLFRWILR